MAQLPLGFVRRRSAAARDSADPATRSSPDRPNAPARQIYTVSELCRSLAGTLQEHHPQFWVSGEISGLRVHRGSRHVYFDLKDADGKIPCVIWSSNRPRVRFELQDGLEVLCHAKTALYPRTGRLQLSVFFMEPRGLGALFAEFEARRERLRTEGLTAVERKRPLPRFPSTIGVVTSRSGAALHDILRTLWRRHPGLRVLLAPAPVQGRSAAPRIRAAIDRLDRHGECDVIILARGGGSLEDLWAFNEEAVARGIAGCRTPIVTGVGHETDTTIADLVADVRASTPTAAAEAVAPVRDEWLRRLELAEARSLRAVRRRLGDRRRHLEALVRQLRHPAERHRALRARLDHLEHRLESALARAVERGRERLRSSSRRLDAQHPRVRVERARARVERAEDRLERAISSRAVEARHILANLSARLESASPVAVLARGYAFVTDASGRVVRRAEQVEVGDPLRVRLASGSVDATVGAVHPEPEENDV